MSPILAFILGVLVGWLIEWVIDWVYWRRRWRSMEESAARGEHEKAALEAEMSMMSRAPSILGEEGSRWSSTTTLPMAVQETAPAPAAAPDNLEVINGIGPVIARLLNQKGIFTFDQLAQQTPEGLRRLLGNAIQRLADEEDLIRQAADLAQRKPHGGV
jgi:large subunit ribosomal protein L21